ncbi:uncharacterized protein M8220_001782 [Acridotheres tristis]
MSRLPGDLSASHAQVIEQRIGLISRWKMASCHPFQQRDEMQELTDPLHPQPGTPLPARTGNSDFLLRPAKGVFTGQERSKMLLQAKKYMIKNSGGKLWREQKIQKKVSLHPQNKLLGKP